MYEGVRSYSRRTMATKNKRSKSDQAALLPPDPSTIPSNENKTAERTESQKTCFVQDRAFTKDELKELEKAFEESAEKNGICIKLPEEVIRERYGISPDQTNIPKLLYALLCEAVSK